MIRPIMAAALLVAVPLAAATPDRELAELQARDQQLFAVGWKLASANAAHCDRATPSLGLSVLDAGGFGDPDAVRRQLGLSADLAAGAVAPGSPAAMVGIAPGDTLGALNGTPLAERFPRAKPAWRRLVEVTAALDAAAAAGPVMLTLARNGTAQRTVALRGIPACPSRFEVLDSGGRAAAEGTRVIFGRGFPGFAYPEAEFAAAVAHEFAHNLLRHRATLDAKGRSLGNVRLTEREDRSFEAIFSARYFVLGDDEAEPTKSQWTNLKKRFKRSDSSIFIFKDHGACHCPDGQPGCYYLQFGYYAKRDFD